MFDLIPAHNKSSTINILEMKITRQLITRQKCRHFFFLNIFFRGTLRLVKLLAKIDTAADS